MVAGVLGVAPPASQPLMEAGLDSLGAVELRNALSAAFGAELGPTVTFDHPTLSALAAHLASLPSSSAAAGAQEQLDEEQQQEEEQQQQQGRRCRSRRRQPAAVAQAPQPDADAALVRCRAGHPLARTAAAP